MIGGGPAIRAIVRAQVRARWRELVAIGLLAGLLGGVVVVALAGARRTSTAYDRLVASTEFPDAFVQLIEPRPALVADIAGLPAVARAEPSVFVVGTLSGRANQVLAPVQASAKPFAELRVVEGRHADPGAVGEAVISDAYADALDLDVGDSFEHRALTDPEFAALLRDRGADSPSGTSTRMRIVGIIQTPSDAVSTEFPTLIGTPAYYERTRDAHTASVGLWVHLRPGADAAVLEEELAAVVGAGSDDRFNGFQVVGFGEDRRAIDDAARVLVVGLVVFGAVTALAAAVLVVQLVARMAEHERHDRQVLRDLGLVRRSQVLVSLGTAWPAASVALAVAAVVAVAGSTTMPLGATRSVEPSPGIELNVAFVGVGALLVAGVVVALWWVGAARRRVPRRSLPRPGRVRRMVSSGGPAAAVASTFAFGAGDGRAARRVAFVGVVVGLAGVIAAEVFGSSLDRMVTDPARWGWPGEHAVEVPEPVREEVYAALDRAEEVGAYAEIRATSVVVDGRDVVAYTFEARRGAIAPVVIEGRPPQGPDEIALGPALLADLGLDVGDVVPVGDGERRIVGRALTFGLADGTPATGGAFVGGTVEAESTTAIVRFREGVDADLAAPVLYGGAEYGPPVRPADVSNLEGLRSLPGVLAVLLGLVATVAIVHLGFTAAVRGRRDLAVLSALGLGRRTAAATVLAAVALVVLAAAVLALPLGLLLGHRTWAAVASATGLGTDARVPATLSVAGPVVAMLVVCCGTLSGRRAVRDAPAAVLRASD